MTARQGASYYAFANGNGNVQAIHYQTLMARGWRRYSTHVRHVIELILMSRNADLVLRITSLT
jgi:hypothetical protein